MSDLIKRLRDPNAIEYSQGDVENCLLIEAADEIELLQTIIKDIANNIIKWEKRR